MLYQLTLPDGLSHVKLIETYISDRHRLPLVPIKKFLSLKELAIIVGAIDPKEYLIHSNTIHGIEFNSTIYVHPTNVYKLAARKFRTLIKKDDAKLRNQLNYLKIQQ